MFPKFYWEGQRSIACYRAHDMIRVPGESILQEMDGPGGGFLPAGPQTAIGVQASGLEWCSTAALRGYLRDRLHVDAATHSQSSAQPSDARSCTEVSDARRDVPSDDRLLTVAICIGTFNQAQYLGDSIASALAQTYPIQEIWVSDDASTDETEQVMAKICAQSAIVHYYKQPTNLGLSRNLSWVLAQPKTDLVVRLDSDDRLEPKYVEVLAALMEKFPSAGFAHCDVFEMNGSGERVRVRRLSRFSEFESADEALQGSASGFRVAVGLLLFRSSALAQAQYYLPTPDWSAGEDWNLCIRLAANGWGNAYAPRPLVSYRQWNDLLNTRAARTMGEVSNVRSIYEETLIPEYDKRGWDTAILRKNMRRRAVGFANSLDSPAFSEAEREVFKGLLRKLGDSFSLSLAIFLADRGFNPVFRSIRAAKVRTKDFVKSCLRVVKSQVNDKGKTMKTQRNLHPAREDEGKW
jgi:GT2 family glycosyltransferase